MISAKTPVSIIITKKRNDKSKLFNLIAKMSDNQKKATVKINEVAPTIKAYRTETDDFLLLIKKRSPRKECRGGVQPDKVSDSSTGKYCGLGPAGFPKQAPAVARPAVSLSACFRILLPTSGTGLPLSPHCNPRTASRSYEQPRSFPQQVAFL